MLVNGVCTRFVLLIMGHALADFSLQTDVMAKHKNRHYLRAVSDIPPKQKESMPTWYYWMTAHALIHGLMVFWMLGSLPLALAETACHWTIDWFKCEGLINKHVDQGLHVLCKVIWAIL